MSLFPTVTAATQLCAGCTLEFEPMDTLGSRDDPAGVGMLADVLRMGDQGYLVSSDVLGGVVIVHDSEGRYQRELTREGEGPGELRGPPQFAKGAGGIVLLGPGTPMLHLYSSDLDLTRTFQVPAVIARSVGPDPVTGGWLVSYIGGDDGSQAGILLLDEGGDAIRSMEPGEESSTLRRSPVDAIRGAESTIWTASMDGLVEVFDQDLGLLGALKLEVPGMDIELPGGGAGGVAAVTDIRLAPDGSGVWVFAWAPVVSPSELLAELQGGAPNLERIIDTFIYSVRLDPSGLTLVGTDQLDTMVRPLGDGDLAYDLVDTPDGNRVVRVGRLRFSGGPLRAPAAADPSLVPGPERVM